MLPRCCAFDEAAVSNGQKILAAHGPAKLALRCHLAVLWYHDQLLISSSSELGDLTFYPPSLHHHPKSYKMTCADFLLVICAFLLPPIPVAFRTGCSCELLVSCILTAAGFVPGLIYSLYIIWHYAGGRHGTLLGPEGGQYGSLA